MKLIIFIVLFCALSPFSSAEQSEAISKIEFLTESYPPYNYIEDGQLKGIAIDLLNETLKQARLQPEDVNIRLLPWPRAYKMATQGVNRVLFSTTRTQEREALFQWAGPITNTKVVLLALTDKNIKIESIEDLANYSIGTIKDDIGEQLLFSMGVPRQQIRQAHSAESLVKMLNKGRVDLWAYEENVARWHISNAHLPNHLFASVYTLKESELFYAFSRGTDPMLISRFQDAIDQIKLPDNEQSQSRYEQILNRYQ